MEWIETTGKTVEEAKEAALDELGVDEVDAEFEVLEEPKSGLFGRVRSEARVRARVRPTKPRPKDDRRDRRRRSGGGRTVKAAAEETAVQAEDGEADEGDDDAVLETTSTGSDSDVQSSLTLDEQGRLAGEFVQELVRRFGANANVEVRTVDDETVEVVVTGQDLGLLIGPKGQTLAAVQELARTVVQRQSEERTGRILVDVAGYRQRRKEALERFTRQVAAEVVASGVRKVLEPMAPPDRKIVHDVANEIDGVRTTSEGEEPRRRVVILPEGGDTAS
jgi:spoIIIJ-associated protein